jgi:hypothetical protein
LLRGFAARGGDTGDMQPIEPGDKVVIKRTNDVATVEKTEEGRAILQIDTRDGQEVTAEFNELSRLHKGATSNASPDSPSPASSGSKSAP